MGIVGELKNALRGHQAHRLVALVEHCIFQVLAELELHWNVDASSEKLAFVVLGQRGYRHQGEKRKQKQAPKAGVHGHGKLPSFIRAHAEGRLLACL